MIVMCHVSEPVIIAGEAKVNCGQCGEWLHRRSMARHVQRKHSLPTSANCDLCDKVFTSLVNLKEHYRKEHGLSTRDKF